MASAPTITRIAYDGAETKVWWTLSSDPTVTGYVILAASADSGISYQSPVISGQSATYGKLQTGTLETGIVYTLQVQAQTAGGPGPASLQLPLITARPTLRSAWYDGTDVVLSWRPVEGAANGYQLAIYSLDSGLSAFATVTDPWADHGTIPKSKLPGGTLDPNQQWVVRVDALSTAIAGGNWVSASSATPHLPKPLPTLSLSSAEYQGGTNIVAAWSAVGSSSITRFVIELTSPQDDGRIAIDITNGSATKGVLPVPRPLAPLQRYMLRVLALTDDGVGVATPAQPVVPALPRIVSAAYDGTNVQLVWLAAVGPLVQSYLLRVMSLSSGQTFTATVSNPHTTIGSVKTNALDAQQTWVASVAAQSPGAAGGASVEFALLVKQPSVSALAYDGAAIEIGWSALAGVARYVAALFNSGSPVQSVEVDNGLATSARIALPAPLGAGSWTVAVNALTAAGASASSVPRALPTTLPALSRAVYDGVSLSAEWAALAGAASFTLSVHSPVTDARYQTTVTPGTATGGTLALPGRLGTDCGYLVTLAAKMTADGTMLSSLPVPLLTALPALDSVSYDGTVVTLRWPEVVDDAATVVGYTAKLAVEGSTTVYTKAVDDPSATSAIIDNLPVNGLDPALTYRALVESRADHGIAAASARVTAVSSVPQPKYATCYSTRIVAGWSPVGGANSAVIGYQLTASSPQKDDVETILIPGNPATSGVLPLRRPLSPTVAYTFSIAAVAPGGAQAVARLSPVIASLPLLQSARYDGASVALTWTPSESPAATSQTLKVISLSSGMTFTAPIANPQATSGSVAVSGGLAADQTWRAEVWAQGVVSGVSDPLALLVRRPVVTAARYDGVSVEAEWTPVLGAGVAGYTLLVTLPDGTQLAAVVPGERGTSSRIALAAPFAAGSTVTVVVVAEAGPVSAASDAVTLDVAQPVVSTLVYQAGSVTAEWSKVANAAVTGYLMQVRAPGGSRDFTQAISGRDTTSGRLAIGGLLASDQPWQFGLWTQAPGGISAGSTPAAIITALPALTEIAYDGANLTAGWTAGPDAQAQLASFILTVRKPADAKPAFSQPIADPFARSGAVAAGGLSEAYVAEIRAVATSGAVTVSAPVALVVAKPALSKVANDGALVTATWRATAGLSAYRLGIYDASDSLVASITAAGTSAALTVALDPAQIYKARLQGVATDSRGPLSDALPILAAAATIDRVDYAPGTLTVTWQPPAQAGGITGYAATLIADGLPQPDTPVYDGNKATFSKTLTANVAYAVVVRATATASSGPASAAVAVVTGVPRLTAAALAGSRLAVAWQALADCAVTGYEVELYQGATRVGRFDTATPELATTLTLTAGAAYSVQVRARAAAASGPWSERYPVSSFGFQYFVQVAKANVQPYLFRTLAASPPVSPAQAIALYLPEIFNTTQTSSISSGAFTLTPTSATPYAYVMNFAADSPLWTFDNQSIRPTLQANYNGFLTALEKASGGLKPDGLALVRDVLATGLPLTFYETLFYRYGFDPVNGYCNLEPGMALRLDSEVFQFEGTSPSATQLSGFVVTGSRDYAIGDYLFPSGVRKTGFDAFLATLQRPAVPVNSRGSGGIIDLYATGYRRRWYRLFYPITFTGADSGGAIGVTNNMALLGCDSWEALVDATGIYLQTGSFAGVTHDIAYTFFRGRMVASPLITVLVNGSPQQVSLGTTVRELVQRIAQLLVAQGTSIAAFRMERLAGNLVNATQTALTLDPTVTNPVNLTANPYQGVLDQPDAFDLPLLNGDRLTLGR